MKQLEYVISSGATVDTGIVLGSNYSVEVDYCCFQTNSPDSAYRQHLFGDLGGGILVNEYQGTVSFGHGGGIFSYHPQGFEGSFWLKNTNLTINEEDVYTKSGNLYSTSQSLYFFTLPNEYGRNVRQPVKLGITRLYDPNDVLLGEFIPVVDDNDVVCFYDSVNDVYRYPDTELFAGPFIHKFIIDKSDTRFDATGGTETVEIEAETTWTASTPSFVSVSPSTGGTGTTQVTISCPSNTGTTRREDVITFTDAEDYTLTFHAKQRGNTVGSSNIYLGDNNLLSNTIYLGDNAVNIIYLGDEIVYSNGPFVGLKVVPQSLALNNLSTTANITIRSSENWTITDDSTVGGYYTLENYTTGCDGWVPSYDGSLDGGEIDENGKWFEWQWGVSQITFQEFVDNLAANGITATGTACQNANYSIYLAPHTTGGPGWLSYSQTTGRTGKTVVTVTASTTQAERTATITVRSANYTATIAVTDNALVMPLDEVWYKTTDNNSMPPKNGTAYIDSNGNNLTFTQSFDSESGLWKMKFNGNVYGNKGSLYYNNSNRLVELWLPYGYVRPDDIFIYGQSNFEKFKGDSQAIVDNGNAVVCLVDYPSQEYGNLQNFVIQAAKNVNATITIPEGVVGVSSYAFYHTTATTVNLPSTITNIGGYSLERSVITTMNCYATTCPIVNNTAWFAVNNNGTLHYPTGSDYSSFTIPSSWTKVGDL